MGWNVYKLLCCCGNSEESTRINVAVSREQQAAAAEARLRREENRGIKNPECVKRIQREQKRKAEADNSSNVGISPGLKWQIS